MIQLELLNILDNQDLKMVLKLHKCSPYYNDLETNIEATAADAIKRLKLIQADRNSKQICYNTSDRLLQSKVTYALEKLGEFTVNCAKKF